MKIIYYVASVNYKDFSYCENVISSLVKINLISSHVIIKQRHSMCYQVCQVYEPKFISIWSKHLRRLLGNIWQPSVIFGNLRTFTEIFGKWSEMFVWTSYSVRRIFKNLRKSSEIFGKLLKDPWYCCLYNKQNITCPRVDTNFIFSC